GAVLLAGAIGAGVWELTRGSSAAPEGSAVALFRSGQPAARVPLERTPSQIAAGTGSVWGTDADDGTGSRIDAQRRRGVAAAALGSTPTAEAFGAGALWLANGRVSSPGSQLIGEAFPDSVSRLDADSGVVTLTRRLPRRGVSYSPVRGTGALAVTDGAVW